MNEGRLAVIGIGNNPTLYNIEAITTLLNIPFISIKWNNNYENDPITSNPSIFIKQNEEEDESFLELDDYYSNLDEKIEAVGPLTMNMHSPSAKIMNAIVDFTDHYRWNFVTILYQESLGLDYIQHLVRTASISHKMLRTQVRQLSSNMNEWIFLLKDVKLSGSSHIIVAIETRLLNEFIEKAKTVELMTAYFHFLFTTLDLSIMTETPAANVTAFQVFRPHDPIVDDLLGEWNIRNALQNKPVEKFLSSDAIMIYDTIQLLANTIINNDLVTTLATSSSSVSCEKESKWAYGATFFNHLKAQNFTGLSGEVSFNVKTGERNNIFLYIVDMTKNGVDLVSQKKKLNLEKLFTKKSL